MYASNAMAKIVERLEEQLHEVHGLLEVVGVATLETLAAGGDEDRDGVRVAVRAEDSHHH